MGALERPFFQPPPGLERGASQRGCHQGPPCADVLGCILEAVQEVVTLLRKADAPQHAIADVETVAEMPVPRQEEIEMPVPMVQERITQEPVEIVVEMPVPRVEEEIEMPVPMVQERITQQPVETVVEMPDPMVQEEIEMPVPMVQERITQQPVETGVEMPVPMVQVTAVTTWEPLKPGDRVRCQQLRAASELNGVCGMVVEFCPGKGRYVVELACSEVPKLLKRENLGPAGSYSAPRALLVRRVFAACDKDKDARLRESELWALEGCFFGAQGGIGAGPAADTLRRGLWSDGYRELCALCGVDPADGFDVAHFAALMDQYCGDDLLREWLGRAAHAV